MAAAKRGARSTLGLTHFERVNLDLMYALPGQTLAQAEADIATAIASGVGHVSRPTT
jgi:coproporphyrinogen III oxidase-like Fe-S oxidoreductase